MFDRHPLQRARASWLARGTSRLRAASQGYALRHAQMLLGSLGRLFRQPFSSLMTMAVIGIALALPAALHVLVINAKALGGRWESVVDVSVYLAPGVSAADAAALAAGLRSRADVGSVLLIPAEDALVEFRELSGFGAALDALEENPLPVTLVVRPASGYESAADIEALGAMLRAMPEAELVQQDIQWVIRLNAMLDIVRRAVTLASVLLALAVVIIVGNTIRLDIQNRSDEIVVTKLIGASDRFIRRPFLYGGFWYGFAGGVLALILVAASLWLLEGPVARVAGLYDSSFRLRHAGAGAAALLVFGGALLGWLGAWLAASRHMREIEPN